MDMPHALREAMAAFRRAPVLTFLSAAMVGLALYVVGLFALAAFNLQLALQAVEERVEVVAYLHEDARSAEVEIAVQQLRALPEVEAVLYVSKEEALQRAQRDLPQFSEVFRDLAVNPLPASLEVRLGEGQRNEDAVVRVAEVAGEYPFVEEVAYGREWVDKLFTLRRVAAATTAILGGAFAAVAALIIGTALKIAIFARRDEIYIMRLVGARDGFIRRPFLLEGAFAGLLGAVLAVGLTWATYQTVTSFLFQVEWVPLTWVALGLLAGVGFGALASAGAIHRHLREV